MRTVDPVAHVEALTPPLIALTLSGLHGTPLGEADREALCETDWAELLLLAKAHDLLPLVQAGADVSDLKPPGGTAETLRAARIIAELRAQRAWYQLTPLVEALGQANIPVTVLKGAQLSVRYYPTPGLRPFGDLDLLVAEEDRERAAAVLQDLGYRNADDRAGGKDWCVENHFHWNFVLSGALSVELHWRLTFPGSAVPLSMDTFWLQAQPMSCGGGTYHVLDLENELVFLAVHITRHCFHLPLRNLVDLAAIAARVPDLDWETVRQRAETLGASVDLLVVLGTAEKLGLLSLSPVMASYVREAIGDRFDLAFLAHYAVECPFVPSFDRLFDVCAATSFREATAGLSKAVFPRYTHLWSAQVEQQTSRHPVRIYGLAWWKRVQRLAQRNSNLGRLIHDLRESGQAYQMFANRRRDSSQ